MKRPALESLSKEELLELFSGVYPGVWVRESDLLRARAAVLSKKARALANAAIEAQSRCIGNLARFDAASSVYDLAARLWERAERINERARLMEEGR